MNRTAKALAAAAASFLILAPTASFAVVGRTKQVQTVAFSPDGKTVASGSQDNCASLWNAKTGALIETLVCITSVNSIDFGPDGKTLATAGEDKKIRLWDVESRKLLNTLVEAPDPQREGNFDGIDLVRFSPDGKSIAAAGNDATIKLWDVATKNLRLTISGHPGDVYQQQNYETALKYSKIALGCFETAGVPSTIEPIVSTIYMRYALLSKTGHYAEAMALQDKLQIKSNAMSEAEMQELKAELEEHLRKENAKSELSTPRIVAEFLRAEGLDFDGYDTVWFATNSPGNNQN